MPSHLHPDDRPNLPIINDCLFLMKKRYEGGALTPLLTDSKINDKVILSNSLGNFNPENSIFMKPCLIYLLLDLDLLLCTFISKSCSQKEYVSILNSYLSILCYNTYFFVTPIFVKTRIFLHKVIL